LKRTGGCALKAGINSKIRKTLSPRHVPDNIYAIPEILQSLNEKKLEVHVKKILPGIPINKAVSIDFMRNPDSRKFFVEFEEKLK